LIHSPVLDKQEGADDSGIVERRTLFEKRGTSSITRLGHGALLPQPVGG